MYLTATISRQNAGMVTVNLPVVGTRREPNIGDEGKATNRIFVSGERSDNLVLFPELDSFVCGAFISDISWARTGKTQPILTGDELFPIDGHNSQNRLSVTF